MNEWMSNFYSNQQDEDRESLIKDADRYDEVMESRENVRCIMCEAHVYRKDSERINGYIVCKACVKAHDMR